MNIFEWNSRLERLPMELANCPLTALWLSRSQSQPIMNLQHDSDPITGEKFLTCYLLPQLTEIECEFPWRPASLYPDSPDEVIITKKQIKIRQNIDAIKYPHELLNIFFELLFAKTKISCAKNN
ncbi:hypothetical protein Ciccas_009889 [Cichlidogyrus casuarinus]|uniref:Uncharacterized protein n=1 Tax=Cichlidogyrus casuarinus TaxID=1844966 RepID=A0ABD2PW73_9PLAT